MRKRFIHRVYLMAIVMAYVCCGLGTYAQSTTSLKKIIVDVNGKGKFRSIQEAINSLSDSADKPRVIHIKSGMYHEKIFISKNNIILEGEDRDKTIITQDIARDEWR